MTKRQIVQASGSYQIQEVTEKNGRIHWEIFDPYGFCSDHTSLVEAQAELVRLDKETSKNSQCPADI
jgi:hypothetical protein